MSILVAYESIEGHTAKIARTIAQQIESSGRIVVLADVRQPGFAMPGIFDSVAICGPIHIGRYPATLARFVSDFSDALNQKPSALITVSLAAASDDKDERAEVQKIADELCEASGWKPTMRLDAAGALKYLEYNYFKRLVMKHIVGHGGGPVDTNQDYEFTDWNALEKFVIDFLEETYETN